MKRAARDAAISLVGASGRVSASRARLLQSLRPAGKWDAFRHSLALSGLCQPGAYPLGAKTSRANDALSGPVS